MSANCNRLVNLSIFFFFCENWSFPKPLTSCWLVPCKFHLCCHPQCCVYANDSKQARIGEQWRNPLRHCIIRFLKKLLIEIWQKQMIHNSKSMFQDQCILYASAGFVIDASRKLMNRYSPTKKQWELRSKAHFPMKYLDKRNGSYDHPQSKPRPFHPLEWRTTFLGLTWDAG